MERVFGNRDLLALLCDKYLSPLSVACLRATCRYLSQRVQKKKLTGIASEPHGFSQVLALYHVNMPQNIQYRLSMKIIQEKDYAYWNWITVLVSRCYSDYRLKIEFTCIETEFPGDFAQMDWMFRKDYYVKYFWHALYRAPSFLFLAYLRSKNFEMEFVSPPGKKTFANEDRLAEKLCYLTMWLGEPFFDAWLSRIDDSDARKIIKLRGYATDEYMNILYQHPRRNAEAIDFAKPYAMKRRKKR